MMPPAGSCRRPVVERFGCGATVIGPSFLPSGYTGGAALLSAIPPPPFLPPRSTILFSNTTLFSSSPHTSPETGRMAASTLF